MQEWQAGFGDDSDGDVGAYEIVTTDLRAEGAALIDLRQQVVQTRQVGVLRERRDPLGAYHPPLVGREFAKATIEKPPDRNLQPCPQCLSWLGRHTLDTQDPEHVGTDGNTRGAGGVGDVRLALPPSEQVSNLRGNSHGYSRSTLTSRARADARPTGTAFPIWRAMSIFVPHQTKSSGNP